jgi:hypothetical protein
MGAGGVKCRIHEPLESPKRWLKIRVSAVRLRLWPPLISCFPTTCNRETGSSSMAKKKISSGVVHRLPADLRRALLSDPKALTVWEDITPLARNEWICWIESAKKAETRSRRIEWGCSTLKEGKRRPCCWPGCSHR